MVLRSLTVSGFKSFADTTTIQFGEGITAILGPNGCGKSNVVDAIRWVFGEQKPSALRSSAMQDVIFSGTQKRQPQGMAEVTLVIENTRKILPVEYSEVAITRRLFRSGESEYLLNKVPCRLRDILDLFVDTGIGTTAYTTIENTMIGLILSDKAEERRQLFDEAAGIGKYKLRRRESQRQLEKTSQDLLRLNDMVQEADRQVRLLGRHVEKARRVKAYREELKTLEVGYENRRYRELGRVVEARRAQLHDRIAARELVRAAIAAAESEIQVKELTAQAIEEEVQRAAAAVAEIGERINTLDRDIVVGEERRRAYTATIERLTQELAQLVQRIDERGHLRVQIEKSMAERVARRAECDGRLGTARDGLEQCDAAIARARTEVERLTAEQIALLTQVGDTRNELANLEAGLTNLLERSDRLERETAALETRIAQYEETVERCRSQLAAATDAQARLCQSRETLLARIDKEDAALQKLVEREKQCEAHIDARKAQLRFLQGLDAAFEGYESGVRALLTSNLSGLIGTAADCLRVNDPETIRLVERALGTAIQTVVFERDDDVTAAIAYLSERTTGAARMVSLERLNTATAFGPATGEGESLRALVSAADGRTAVADYLLAHVRVVPTAADALRCAARGARETVFVSRDGAVCRGDGTVVAGRGAADETGLLHRKAQIEQLGRDIERLEREYHAILAEKDVCIINRDEAKFALAEVDDKISRGRQEQQDRETTIRHHEREIEASRTRLEEQRAEAALVRAAAEEQRERIIACRSRLDGRRTELETLEQRLAAARETVGKLQAERQVKAEHLRNMELEIQGLENQITRNTADIERLGKELREYEDRRTAIGREQEAAAAAIRELDTRLASLRTDRAAALARRTELESEAATVRERYNGMLAQVDEMRKQVRSRQQELDAVSTAVHELEMEQARDEQERRRIRERLYEVHEVDLESAGTDLPALEDDPSITEKIEVLRERIKRVGEVNMAALEDFETENARLQQLTAQRDDLQTAVNDLTAAIKKLDREARAQFLATFEQVRKNFAEMFTTLFEGGEATLELQPDVDPLEANIVINARPAGKKMRGVQPLSGGERALTAIALLFGLYMVRPSAYCILDELDAPLDDANIERFARILRRFSERTQFIVITHNKRTMEAADLLYGVTQQERGVSRVVSVKLDDALLQAA